MATYRTLVKKISVASDMKIKRKDYKEKGSLAIVDQGQQFIGGYSDNTEKRITCELPVLVFGDHTRIVKYIDFPFCAGADGIKILQAKPTILPKYLYFGTQYLVLKMSDRGYARHYQYIEKMDLPVPTYEEQKRMVCQIEELFSKIDKGVETLQKAKKQLKVYRQSILMNAFSTFSVGEKEYTTLGEVIDVLTDYHANGSYESLKANVKLLDEPNYAIMIRSTNFEQNDFTNNLKYIDEHSYNFLKKSQLFGDEVLMGKIGNAGRVYYMKDLGKPMSLAMNMFAMRFKKNVLSKYVYYYLLQPLAQKDIKQYVKGIGTPTIDKKSVRSLKFEYPISLDTQNVVVKMVEYQFSVCDDIEKTIENTLSQTEAMRQSILKTAFEGRF